MSTFKVDVLQSRSGGATTFTNQWASKAWVNFDGTAVTITPRSSGNVGSLTDNGTGDYTANFTVALASANYSPVISTSGGSTNGITGAVKASAYNGTLTNMTTTALNVYTYNLNAQYDCTLVSIVIAQ